MGDKKFQGIPTMWLEKQNSSCFKKAARLGSHHGEVEKSHKEPNIHLIYLLLLCRKSIFLERRPQEI